MSDETKQYAWSRNEEDFFGTYDSREDAIADAEVEFCVFTGEMVPRSAEEMVQPDWIIEQIIDFAFDDVGEIAEGFAHGLNFATKEQKDDLRSVVAAWMNRHNLQPTFFTVTDVQSHEVPEQQQ